MKRPFASRKKEIVYSVLSPLVGVSHLGPLLDVVHVSGRPTPSLSSAVRSSQPTNRNVSPTTRQLASCEYYMQGIVGTHLPRIV